MAGVFVQCVPVLIFLLPQVEAVNIMHQFWVTAQRQTGSLEAFISLTPVSKCIT